MEDSKYFMRRHVLSFLVQYLVRGVDQVDGVSGKSLSFQEVHEQARAVAAALSELGVSPGETIAVSCENRFEYAVVLLASVYSCNTFAPINPVYSPGVFTKSVLFVGWLKLEEFFNFTTVFMYLDSSGKTGDRIVL